MQCLGGQWKDWLVWHGSSWRKASLEWVTFKMAFRERLRVSCMDEMICRCILGELSSNRKSLYMKMCSVFREHIQCGQKLLKIFLETWVGIRVGRPLDALQGEYAARGTLTSKCSFAFMSSWRSSEVNWGDWAWRKGKKMESPSSVW